LYFQWWNIVQLALGAAVLALTTRRADARRIRIVVAAMVGAVIVMLAWMTPEMTALGRRLDFVPRDPAPPEIGRFWMLHGAYTLLEMAKLIASLFVAASLARASERVASEV
jgi:hypothetical protein